jgi:hypothetical protein
MFEQDRLLVRLQQRVMGEANVMACFLAVARINWLMPAALELAGA